MMPATGLNVTGSNNECRQGCQKNLILESWGTSIVKSGTKKTKRHERAINLGVNVVCRFEVTTSVA